MSMTALIMFFLFMFTAFLFLGYVVITAPVALPYLKVKFKKGVLLILKTNTGYYRLVPVDESYHSKKYGTFIPNQEAIIKAAGINMALGSTNMAVIPSQEACIAGEKLENAQVDVYTDINLTAQAAEQKGILTKVDVDALYRYSQNISPNFVEKRIAIRTAEILANNRDNLGKLFGYAIIFIMVMIGAGIAIYMINSGSGSVVTDAVSSATTMNI